MAIAVGVQYLLWSGRSKVEADPEKGLEEKCPSLVGGMRQKFECALEAQILKGLPIRDLEARFESVLKLIEAAPAAPLRDSAAAKEAEEHVEHAQPSRASVDTSDTQGQCGISSLSRSFKYVKRISYIHMLYSILFYITLY